MLIFFLFWERACCFFKLNPVYFLQGDFQISNCINFVFPVIYVIVID